MLELLRRGVKTWVAKALLGILILSFAVWGIGGEIFSFSMSTPVASVGETKVTAEQFSRAMQREQNQLSQRSGELVSYDTIRQLGMDQRVLAGLLRDAAFDEELNTLGIRIPDAAALQAMASRTEFQAPDGSLSRAQVQQYMRQLGMSEEQFIDLNRRLVGQNLLIGPAVAATRSPPGMAARLATYQGEMRQVKSAVLPLALAPDPGAPNEDQLAAFYEAHPERYTEPARRWGEYLHVDIHALEEDARPTEEETRAAYNADKDVYAVTPARVIDQMPMSDLAAARAAIERVEKGEVTFEDIVAENGFALADVEIGRVGPGDVPEATAEAIFAVTEPGTLVPVELPIGTAIVRVRDVTQGGAVPFEDVRAEIETRLAREAAFNRAPQIANQIEEMRAGGSSFADIAEATGLTLGEFNGLGPDGTLPDGPAQGILASPIFIQEVFEALDGEERPIIDTGDGSSVVIFVDREVEGGLQSLDTVRDRAIADWQDAQRVIALTEQAEQLAGTISQGTSIDTLAPELGVEVIEQIPFTRETGPSLLPQNLVDAAFAAETGAGLSARLPDGDGVIVAEVASSIQLPADLAEQATSELDGLIEQSIRADAAEMLARAITERHEPQTNPTAMEEVFNHLTGRYDGAY
ncbi:MAG: SurA N-terminal domain-containing protein [Pseudomonadota bacterium]